MTKDAAENMATKRNMIIVVIPVSEVRNFIILEMGVGTGVYYALEAFFSSILVSMTGAMAITEGIKRGIPFVKGRCGHLHSRKFSHQWRNAL